MKQSIIVDICTEEVEGAGNNEDAFFLLSHMRAQRNGVMVSVAVSNCIMGVNLLLRVTFPAAFRYYYVTKNDLIMVISLLLLQLSIFDYSVDTVTQERVQERERERRKIFSVSLLFPSTIFCLFYINNHK